MDPNFTIFRIQVVTIVATWVCSRVPGEEIVAESRSATNHTFEKEVARTFR